MAGNGEGPANADAVSLASGGTDSPLYWATAGGKPPGITCDCNGGYTADASGDAGVVVEEVAPGGVELALPGGNSGLAPAGLPCKNCGNELEPGGSSDLRL